MPPRGSGYKEGGAGTGRTGRRPEYGPGRPTVRRPSRLLRRPHPRPEGRHAWSVGLDPHGQAPVEVGAPGDDTAQEDVDHEGVVPKVGPQEMREGVAVEEIGVVDGLVGLRVGGGRPTPSSPSAGARGRAPGREWWGWRTDDPDDRLPRAPPVRRRVHTPPTPPASATPAPPLGAPTATPAEAPKWVEVEAVEELPVTLRRE